jgi:hypothetical protein
VQQNCHKIHSFCFAPSPPLPVQPQTCDNQLVKEKDTRGSRPWNLLFWAEFSTSHNIHLVDLYGLHLSKREGGARKHNGLIGWVFIW